MWKLSKATGISKSTLSRLETGQRKPSLELLLPIAQAYRVGLDDLVGAPEVGDPRIRPHPQKRGARVVVPLTGHPNGTQVPHWFGAAGDQPVEMLSLLSRPGERAHVRAAPRRKNAR